YQLSGGNARGAARLFACASMDGELDGIRLLSARTIDLMTQVQWYEKCAVWGTPMRTALGFLVNDPAFTKNPSAVRIGVPHTAHFSYHCTWVIRSIVRAESSRIPSSSPSIDAQAKSRAVPRAFPPESWYGIAACSSGVSTWLTSPLPAKKRAITSGGIFASRTNHSVS